MAGRDWDTTHCPTCGKDVGPEAVMSYSLVHWNGTSNHLEQMFCTEHPPSCEEASPLSQMTREAIESLPDQQP